MTRCAYGIDLGGTNIKFVIVSDEGKILHDFQEKTPHTGTEDIVTAICRGIEELDRVVAEGEIHGVTKANVVPTAGIALPGIVDEDNGMAVWSVNLGWKDCPMAAMITDRIQRPIALGHDVRSGALGEFMWGVMKNEPVKTGFYVAVGTGIAMITVIDGTVLRPHPWTGEVGQAMTVDPDTGDEVTVEKICSAAALANRMRALEPESLDEHAGAKEVFDLAAQGNETAAKVISTGVKYLAETIASAAYLMGSIPVVIGGGLVQAGDEYLEPLRKALDEATPGIDTPVIHGAVLGTWSQALGAAARALNA